MRRSSSTVFWPNHWNGVNGLGTKPPSDTVTDGLLVCSLPMLDAVAGQLADAEGVLVGLGGEPDQEVELHPRQPLA